MRRQQRQVIQGLVRGRARRCPDARRDRNAVVRADHVVARLGVATQGVARPIGLPVYPVEKVVPISHKPTTPLIVELS